MKWEIQLSGLRTSGRVLVRLDSEAQERLHLNDPSMWLERHLLVGARNPRPGQHPSRRRRRAAGSYLARGRACRQIAQPWGYVFSLTHQVFSVAMAVLHGWR